MAAVQGEEHTVSDSCKQRATPTLRCSSTASKCSTGRRGPLSLCVGSRALRLCQAPPPSLVEHVHLPKSPCDVLSVTVTRRLDTFHTPADPSRLALLGSSAKREVGGMPAGEVSFHSIAWILAVVGMSSPPLLVQNRDQLWWRGVAGGVAVVIGPFKIVGACFCWIVREAFSNSASRQLDSSAARAHMPFKLHSAIPAISLSVPLLSPQTLHTGDGTRCHSCSTRLMLRFSRC